MIKSNIKIKCKQCGVEYCTTPSYIKLGRGLYCSRKCYIKHKKGRKNPLRVRRSIAICKVCKKKYLERPCDIKRKGNVCSNECKRTAREQRKLFKRELRKCDFCGKEYYAMKNRLKHNSNKYCSSACFFKAFKLFYRGERTSNWHGGKGKGVYPYLFLKNRKVVLARDMFKCTECNKSTLKLHVHHIDYNVSNNELNNLITLCSSCHAKTNFKRNDWIEYFRRKNAKSV